MVVRFRRELHSAFERAGNPLRAQLRGVPLHSGNRRRREMYVQRLQACVLVLEVLVYHMDYVSLVVGRSPDGDFKGVKLETIAELTGLEPRRVDRAVRDIHAAGFLVSHKRAEPLVGGGYRGHTSIRQLSIELFYAVGMGTEFEKFRGKVYRRRVDRQAMIGTAYSRLKAKARDFQNELHERQAPAVVRRIGDYVNKSKPPT